MIEPRLAAALLVQALLRQVQQQGGFGAILHKGDEISGSILVSCLNRGENPRLLERMPQLDGPPLWHCIWPQDTVKQQLLQEYIDKRLASDPDLWIVELDIADAERLVRDFTLSA